MSDHSAFLKIMVVDDSPFNLALMDTILSADYIVQLVNNGPKALQLAETDTPDLILLDIMMPDMDGFEVCRRLKANPKTNHIPVIFVTAKQDIKDEELGFELGASDFLHKPISAPVVAARVKTHLKVKLMLDFLELEGSFLQDQVNQHSAELDQLKELCGVHPSTSAS